jgi:hypothetical protein
MNNQEKLFIVKQAINIMPAFRNLRNLGMSAPKPVGTSFGQTTPRLGPLSNIPGKELKGNMKLIKGMMDTLKKLPKGWKGNADDLDFFLNA